MKKSQRLRLAALLAQATRTDSEQAELQTLQALATANPDASKDTDDAKPTTVEGLMAKFTALFSAKEVLAIANNALTQRIAAFEAGCVGAVNLVSVLLALGLKAESFAGKSAAEIAASISAPATATAGQIATLTTERNTAATALSTLAGHLGIAAADLAGKDAAGVTAAFEKVVSARTLAQVKELGFNAAELPQPKSEGKNTEAKELHAQYDALIAEGKSSEAGQFYAKNFSAMFPSPGSN